MMVCERTEIIMVTFCTLGAILSLASLSVSFSLFLVNLDGNFDQVEGHRGSAYVDTLS